MRGALALLFVACATPVASQGGAGFRDVKVEPSAVPLQALFGVCWPQDAASSQRVQLTWLPNDVMFEAREGASNSTGRCVREIATTFISNPRPTGTMEVAPPTQPLDGWAVLAWVKLLAPGRFGPERGLVDPAPLVAACLSRSPLRATTAFVVKHIPGPEVRVVPSVLSESERCVEAVLASTAWPSPRELFFDFKTAPLAAANDEVSTYFGPASSTGSAVDPQAVKDAVRLVQPKVASCWDAALLRRASIGGARTLRFTVDDTGTVTRAWVASGLADGPAAADYLLDQCLVAALKQAHFPRAAADGFYTWVFATRG
jgi:hypothetical protein